MNSSTGGTWKKANGAALAAMAVFIFIGGAALPLPHRLGSRVERHAVNHNTWTSGAAMPTALNWPGVGVIKGKIYVVGGYTGGPATADNQVYNPVANTWTSAAPIPTATAQPASAVVKNILYLFGGSSNGGGAVTNAVWAYNPKTDTWTPKTAMPTARCSATAVADKAGMIYVIGGYNGTGSRRSKLTIPRPTRGRKKRDCCGGSRRFPRD